MRRTRNISLILIISLLGFLNLCAFTYVFFTNRSNVTQNCKQNDAQNKILGRLLDETLRDVKAENLNEKQLHSYLVFLAAREDLKVPTCSSHTA